MKYYNKNPLSGKTNSRRKFLKTGALMAVSASFAGKVKYSYSKEKNQGVKNDSTTLFSSDFVPEGSSLKLAFVADHHYWPNHFKNWGAKQFRHTKERMYDLIETLNSETPDISIHGGDVIDAGTAFEPPLGEYIKQLDFEKEMLDALQHPSIPIVGNHEVPDARYESESELARWKERFGPLYDFLDIKGWRLVWLNNMIPNPGNIYGSGPIYGIDDSQLNWLGNVLNDAASKKISVLIFAHIPPENYINENEFKHIITSPGCVKGIMVGHQHRNYKYMIEDVLVMARVANVCSPMGYTMVYPYPDGRIIVVQKSQHFPFIDYISNSFTAGAQGEEKDRYYTLGGSSKLPLNGLKVINKYARADIKDGHLTLQSDKGKGLILIDKSGLTNVRISFSAVKEGATHMGVVAYASNDGLERVEGVLTSEYGPDGNMFLASYSGNKKETLARSWFNISDGIAYKFVLEAKNGKITLLNKNMPKLTTEIKDNPSGKFGFFVENGKMFVTDLRIEKLNI